MKKSISILSSLLIFILFLIIRISYNGGAPSFVYEGLYVTLLDVLKNGLKIRFEYYDVSLAARLVEIIIIFTGLLLTSVFNKWKIILFFQFFLLFYWLILSIMSAPYIEVDLYYLSSMPFILALCFFIYLQIKNNVLVKRMR